MKLHEFRAIRQRVATSVEQHDDAQALVCEVEHLRAVLESVACMTGDPAIVRVIDEALSRAT
jgi:hypothetical protein